MWGLQKQNTVFATGKSILNRTSKTNIGELMLHTAAAATKMPAPARSPTIRRRPSLQELDQPGSTPTAEPQWRTELVQCFTLSGT